jgi:predicted alpha/beta superfamily hydrolase
MLVRSILACALLLLAACAAAPAPTPNNASPPTLAALEGDYFRIDSAILQRPLHIYVRLPALYARESESYPTVYLLDGDSLFPMLAPTHIFAGYDEHVPEAIVVGVAYGTFGDGNMRHIDFAPAPEGDAAAFQRFLAEELIPEIERRYRSDASRRVLAGQSRGGSFVLYSALTAPDLFWGRIASNPALAPREVFYAGPAAAAREDLRVFVASGERDRPSLRAQALDWFAYADARDWPWELETTTIENGTHAARMGEVYVRGMVWLFREDVEAATAAP